MKWVAYAQSRTAVIDLGTARTPEAALALARRKLNGNAAGACVGCRPAGRRKPSAKFGTELAQALCGIQPGTTRERKRIIAALWRMERIAGQAAAARARRAKADGERGGE